MRPSKKRSQLADEDVAARLKRLTGFASFKEAVNAALRVGLDQLESPPVKATLPYRIQPVNLGAKITNIDFNPENC